MLSLIPRLLGLGVGLISVFWLALAGMWACRHYDELPTVPSYQVRVLFFHWTLRPPHQLWPEYVLAVEAREAQAAKVAAQVAQRQTQISTAANAAEVQVETVTRWRTHIILGAIPDVLPPATDQRYPLPNGLVRLYDASVWGLSPADVPNPAGEPDDAASAVTASAAAGVFTTNNGECRVDQERLTALQQWVTDEQRASAKGPP